MAIVPGRTLSAAGPANRTASATICMAVFHLASLVTWTCTLSSARNSRRPETRISRQRMTMAAQIDHPLMVLSCTSIISAAPTMSLSAMGSSMRPSVDCCSQARAR